MYFCGKETNMKHFLNIFLALFVVIFVSCGPSQEERARAKLSRANTFLHNNDITQAMVEIDSIPILYPKALYSINAAKNLKNEINLDLLQRFRSNLDSVKSLIEQLEKNFNQEKTEYDKFIQYTPKLQNFESRWNESYLKVQLDERGEIFFLSNYYGNNSINHTAVRISDGISQAETGKIEPDDANNHRSDFMDGKWEKVAYRNGKENGVIEFIANNTGRRLKAVYLGDRYYNIILEDYDKTAFKEAFNLSKALKRKLVLEQEIKRLQSILNIEG
jgi:hypothetical protein